MPKIGKVCHLCNELFWQFIQIYFLGVYNELVEMRKACGESHMKSILAVGELSTLTNVYKASLVAMMAGSDFIKTSTG